MREKPSISEEALRACLQEQYNISPVTLDFLPLGLDTRAGVFRAVSEQGAPFLLKVKPIPLYEPSCLIPRYLRDQEIASVVAPLPTKKNTLWTQVGEWAVIVYPFIDGKTGWRPALNEGQWKATGAALKEIHSVSLPPGGMGSLRKEAFDPTGYGRWISEVEMYLTGPPGVGTSERALHSGWIEHQTTIRTLQSSMEVLAAVLREQSGPFVICHADLHPGNIIRGHSGDIFVIDWDDVMLAPRERDFIFVGEVGEDRQLQPHTSPFFQGYGHVNIDWVALIYYRLERVVQDMIAWAQDVFFRDDLEEETKAEAVHYFKAHLAEGGEVDVVWALAAHLPAGLLSSNKV
ncbi:MAG: aminoglycoside phosphotransferase family protein [Chloroflexota bacterium]